MRAVEYKVATDRAKKDYSTENAKNRYVRIVNEVGLWKSEEFVFKKFIDQNKQILDVGCGAGRTTFGLYNLGYKNIIGLDISKGLLKEAKKLAKDLKLPVPFVVGDAMALGFENASFDVVIFSYNGLMTIPGSENRQKAVQEIARVLKPGGLFIFTTHDRDLNFKDYSEFWKKEKIRWQSGVQDERLHEFGDRIVDEEGMELFVHIPTVKEVYSLLKHAGLKCIYTQMRWDICATPKIEKENFGECRFFVAKKETK